MTFLVASYGTRQIGMLLAHLQSVAASHPDARQTVYWQDKPAHLIEPMRAAFPHVRFIQTDIAFDRDPLQRISSKVLLWSRAAWEHEGDGPLVFCDADTLVRRTLDDVFAENADVIFTKKDGGVPLNTGVMLARGGPAATAFFEAWRDETVAILRAPELFAQANDPALPYGGTDQMSLHRMLAYDRARDRYTLRCAGHEVALLARPCAELNETRSRPLSDELRVIHYKSGWQLILLDGRPFSPNRRRADSWEMCVLFYSTLAAGLERVNRTAGTRLTFADFGVRAPWFLRDGQFSWPGYAAWRARAAAKRAWQLLTGQLKPGM